jgi:hypothetical protein
MKLYQYDDIKKLNQALTSFTRNSIKIENVELISIEDKIHYFVLAETKEPKKVKSKTEEKATKLVKEKK